MNFDLEDGKAPVSFSLRADDAERFMDFMAECQQIKESKDSNKRMFLAAAADLAAIHDALGLDPDDAAGAGPILEAVEELKKEAARYRWLAERFTGFDADWMADEENGEPGKFVLVFNAPEGFRVGRDIGPCIDEWLSSDRPSSETGEKTNG
jgi:hypothetical protein